MSQQSDLKDGWDEIEQLYEQALEMLVGLDRLGLYQAGAHLSLAIEAMRRHHPRLSTSPQDIRTSSPSLDR